MVAGTGQHIVASSRERGEYIVRWVRARFATKIMCSKSRLNFKTESTRKSSNIYLSWTKIEYQNNLNPIALFSTLNKR